MGCCSSRPPVTVTRRSGGPQHIPITANEWNNSNETEGRNVEVERTHNSIESGEVTLLEPSLSSSPTPAPSSSSSTTSANSPLLLPPHRLHQLGKRFLAHLPSSSEAPQRALRVRKVLQQIQPL